MSIREGLLIVPVSLFVLSGCGRNKENVVAEVNGEKITTDEFAERYKQYFSLGAQRDNLSLRQKILTNMVNERLIYADVARQGFDNDEVCRKRTEEIESRALADAYTKRISIDTLTMSEQELQNEFKAYNTKVKARYLYADSEEGALKLKDALANGATFESLAKDVFDDPGLANNGGDLGYFGWGDMEPALEEAAYSLPVGTVSEPIRLRIGFGIIEVLDRVSNPLPSEMDYAKVKEKLQTAVEKKKTLRLVSDAAHQIQQELAPKFDDRTVALVYKNWQFVLGDKLSQVERQPVFKDTLKDLPLVTFKDRSWSVGDFVSRLMKTSERQRKRVKKESNVKEMATGLAVRDVLMDRARKSGVADNDEVRAQIKQARELFLLKRWMLSVRDTVGQHGWDEKILREKFEKNKKEYAFAPEVNVAEVLVRTKREAENILTQLQRGANFAELARKYSLRRSVAKRGGELGWGTQGRFGNLGERFLAARVGEVIGPEFVDPYFGVFKVLGKSEGRARTFEEAKEQIAASLANAKKFEAVEKAVNALRSHAEIKINQEQLSNVAVNSSTSKGMPQ